MWPFHVESVSLRWFALGAAKKFLIRKLYTGNCDTIHIYVMSGKNIFTYFGLPCLFDHQGSRLTFRCDLFSAWKANWRWINFGVFNPSTPKNKIPIVSLKYELLELDRGLGLKEVHVKTENSCICYWTGWSCSPLSVEIFIPATFMVLLMRQSIPAVPMFSRGGGGGRASPRALAFFFKWVNSSGRGHRTCLNAPGWERRKRANVPPPGSSSFNTSAVFLLISE